MYNRANRVYDIVYVKLLKLKKLQMEVKELSVLLNQIMKCLLWLINLENALESK